MSTVVFTLRDGLFYAYYFKCNKFWVEIYLSRVSLGNLQRILIIHCVFATEYCVRCSKHRAWPTSATLSSSVGELPCKSLLSRENSFKSHYYHDRTHRPSTVSTAYKALIHCTSIPNIPSAKSRWLFFLQRPVRRLNPLLCQEWCQSLKTNQKMPVGKGDIITFCFSLKKTWIEENADWIWSAKTLLRVFVWVSPLQTLKCIQTKTLRFIQ